MADEMGSADFGLRIVDLSRLTSTHVLAETDCIVL